MTAWTRDIRVLPDADRLDELDSWARDRLKLAHASQPARLRWALTVGFLRRWLRTAQASDNLLNEAAAEKAITQREALSELPPDEQEAIRRAVSIDLSPAAPTGKGSRF